MSPDEVELAPAPAPLVVAPGLVGSPGLPATKLPEPSGLPATKLPVPCGPVFAVPPAVWAKAGATARSPAARSANLRVFMSNPLEFYAAPAQAPPRRMA